MSEIKKPDIDGNPFDKIAEFVLKQKFPEHFEREAQGVFQIEIRPGKLMTVTEPSVYNYVHRDQVYMVCTIGTQGTRDFESSRIETDRDGIITGVSHERFYISIGKSEGIKTEDDVIEHSYLAHLTPDVLNQIRKIGREYYVKMAPLIRERDRIVSRVLEVMFERT